MTSDQQIQYFNLLCWDVPYTAHDLARLFSGEIDTLGSVDRTWLYARILNTYNWYVAKEIIGPERLESALNDAVLQKLFPRNLGEKYRHVRNVLFSATLPAAG